MTIAVGHLGVSKSPLAMLPRKPLVGLSRIGDRTLTAVTKDRRPQLLWLICPILIYWIGRALLMAHRRLLDDDPIIFALRDRISHAAGMIAVLLILAAI
jgi:hypothetical protein